MEDGKWRGEWYPAKVEFTFTSKSACDVKISYADFDPETTKAGTLKVDKSGAMDFEAETPVATILMLWVGPNYGTVPFASQSAGTAQTWSSEVPYSGWAGLGEVTNIGEVPFKYSVVATSPKTSTITMKRDQPIRLNGKRYLQSARVTYIVDKATGIPLKITGKETQPGYKLEYKAVRTDSITLPTPGESNWGL